MSLNYYRIQTLYNSYLLIPLLEYVKRSIFYGETTVSVLDKEIPEKDFLRVFILVIHTYANFRISEFPSFYHGISADCQYDFRISEFQVFPWNFGVSHFYIIFCHG